VISYDREQSYGQGSQKKTLEENFGFHKKQLLNMQYLMDLECQKENYLAPLIEGPSCKACAKQYIARINPDPNIVDNYLTFSGETGTNKMTVKKSGVVAICYCARVSDLGECLNPSYWLYAGRMTIRGPRGGQEWVFPTHVIVKMKVFGWGLDGSDKLRIIPATASCADASGGQTNNPQGFTKFKVGCPAVGLDCKKATTNQQIKLNALSSTSTGVVISSVVAQPTHSTLTFSSPITEHLALDDVITMDIQTIKVADNLLAAMTAAQKYDAFRLAGEYQFVDDAAKNYIIGHRLDSEPDDSGTGIDQNKMRIPVGWPSDPGFKMKENRGSWTRRNTVETKEEIKGIEQQAQLKACWGADDDGTVKFYAQAGVVTFENPPAMRAAKVNLSAKENGKTAPIIISFTTGPERSTYASARGRMLLVLRFVDVQNKLVPKYTGDIKPSGGVPEPLSHEYEVPPAARKQTVCGHLFAELWSNDGEGFPVPRGCFYGKKYKDHADEDNPSPKWWREFMISFDTRNGLKHKCHKGGLETNCEYQIVMNAQASQVVQDDQLVDIYAMCENDTGCDQPYTVFEKGSGTASLSTVNGALETDPVFAEDGFVIQRGTLIAEEELLNLSEFRILQVRIKGGSDRRSIKAGALLRVFLWPLLQWDIGSADCTAECRPYHELGAKCTGQVGCSPQEVVAGSSRKNVIRLRLPVDMESEINGIVTHTIKVTGLTLPTGGFFPNRVGVELTKADNTAPNFITSTGYLWKLPEKGQTTGRLVVMDQTGYGPSPFQEDQGNTLYVRVSFGATLWNNGHQLDAATLSIQVPDGYSCSVPDSGAAGADLNIFAVDDDVDGYPDNNRGTLGIGDDGKWTPGQVCLYTLQTNNAIYAGQVVYVKTTVNNPKTAMQKLDPKNLWKVKLRGIGILESAQTPYDMGDEEFITLEEEKKLGSQYWAGNVAVLSSLKDDNLQPATDFTRSCCGATFDLRRTQQYVNVFFKTAQDAGREGYIMLDAPPLFNFGQSCNCGDLANSYYAFTGDAMPRTMRLKEMGACVGSRYPATSAEYNRARIQVKGKIVKDTYYGFKIFVTHPTSYDTSQHNTWRLWTQDKNGYGLDGSRTTVKFNVGQAASETNFYHKSYGMADSPASQVQIQVINSQPKSITTATTGVIVYPIEVAEDVDTSLRITAPHGFVWENNDATFEKTTNSSDGEWQWLPTVTNQNQLTWNSVTLKKGKKYGFVSQVTVPNKSPTASSNSFFIEFGYKESTIEKRFMAAVIPAHPVKSLINCAVSYMTNREGYP
jgi:hypothetical protein